MWLLIVPVNVLLSSWQSINEDHSDFDFRVSMKCKAKSEIEMESKFLWFWLRFFLNRLRLLHFLKFDSDEASGTLKVFLTAILSYIVHKVNIGFTNVHWCPFYDFYPGDTDNLWVSYRVLSKIHFVSHFYAFIFVKFCGTVFCICYSITTK